MLADFRGQAHGLFHGNRRHFFIGPKDLSRLIQQFEVSCIRARIAQALRLHLVANDARDAIPRQRAILGVGAAGFGLGQLVREQGVRAMLQLPLPLPHHGVTAQAFVIDLIRQLRDEGY